MSIVAKPNKRIGPRTGVRCSRCGRVLEDPKSIEDGIGPKCKAKLAAEQAREQALHHGGLTRFWEAEREIDVILEKRRAEALPVVKGVFSEV